MIGRITFRGLTLGTGTRYGIRAVEGWEDLPDLADDSEAYTYDDGESVGDLRAAGRTVTVAGYVYDRDATDGLVAALAAATRKSRALDVLTVEQFGRTLAAQARVLRRALPQAKGYGAGWQEWTLAFRCPDPRRYLPTAGDVATGLPTVAGGIALPVALPVAIGSPTSTGILALGNAGDAPYRPVLRAAGPLPNGFEARHVETGRRLRYEAPLAKDDTLVLDCGRRRVRLNGDTDRRAYLTVAEWFEVPGGQDGAPGGATLAWASLGPDLDPAASLAAVTPPAGALW